MKKEIILLGVLVFSLLNAIVYAQEQPQTAEKLEEIVITATKFNLNKKNTGKVITKISQEQLQNNAGKSVIEILNTVVGIDVRGVNANATEPRSINVRGGRSRQVLVLIDGVPVTDQSGINQEFDLRLLSLSQIESIEILKGASSTLYGSGAATAVINIILIKASKDQISGSFETHLGTNNTASTNKSKFSDGTQNFSLRGTLGDFNFLGAFSVTGINGMSSAKNKTAIVFENDSYASKNGLLKLGYRLSKKFNVQTFLNYDTFDYDFDTGAFADSDVNTGNQEQLRFGIQPTYSYQKGKLYLIASFNTIERELNQFNSFSNTLDAYQFRGRSLNLDFVHHYEFSSQLQLITGINYQKHSNNSITPFGIIDKEIANFTTFDPYASVVYIAENGFSINFGGRLNIHNVYGNQFVYDGNFAQNFVINEMHSIKGIASYSTAFITPSLYQLYDGFSGNIALNPESNKTFEVGFEYDFKDWFSMDAVYFNRKETDAIIYDNTTYTYANSSSDANGLEINAKVSPVDFLTLASSYTYIQRDKFEGADDYITKHKLVTTLEVVPFVNSFISLTYRNVASRAVFDRYGSFGTAGTDRLLPKYQVVDLMANYKFLDNTVSLFGAITNAFNEDYDDILGFSTRGRNYKIGVRLQF